LLPAGFYEFRTKFYEILGMHPALRRLKNGPERGLPMRTEELDYHQIVGCQNWRWSGLHLNAKAKIAEVAEEGR
jgi:hypothetical protein